VTNRYRNAVISRDDDPEAVLIGQLIEDIDRDWQVVYRLAIQDSEQVVIAGLTIRPRDWRASGARPPAGRGLAPGGLSSRQLRSLKPGTSLRDFVAAARDDPGRFRPAVDEVGILDLAALFGAEATAEFQEKLDGYFFEWLELLKTFPVFRPSSIPVQRRLRLARTAALYVKARDEGYAAPRKRVAELQGRAEAAVRDDLYAARHESPPLLSTSPKGRAGGVLTDAAIAILESRDT